MFGKMHRALESIGGWMHTSRIRWLLSLHREEGTKSAWAKKIVTLEGIPELYLGYFEAHCPDDGSFPYTVLVPGFDRLGHAVSEKLISSFEQEIHVLERNGDAFSAQCFPVDEIRYVEVRTVLLDSHIKVSGQTSAGVPTSAVIQFNSVTDYLFTPILNTIRNGFPIHPGQGSGSYEWEDWSNSNFKFMNYARRSLMRGERVIHAILQPEIRTDRFTFLGRSLSRMLSPTHAVLLTDREWITIREEAVQGRQDKYGATWVYIPLNKITASALDVVNDDLLALSIQLPEKERFDYLFQTSKEAEVRPLLDRLQELIPSKTVR